MKLPTPARMALAAFALPAFGAWQEAPPKLRDIPGIEKTIVVLATPAAPKHGEQSVVRLKDGRLFLLWSEFVREDLMPAGDRPPPSPLRRDPTGDDGYARISGKTSADGGRTWSAPWVVVDDKDALVNCISPSITRMADGRILLAYSWRSGGNGATNYGNCAKMVRISSDEGKTWSERIQITPNDTDYHTGCHDRAWTLDNGRVIVQCHTIFPPGVAQPSGPGLQRTCMGTYYAYSDSQITAMRKQSGEFRRLDDDLKRCSEKSAEGIERREEIPAEIAKIRMSKGGLNAKKEKQIEKLRAEQERLKGADMSQCAAMESKLTQLLEGTYAEKDEGGLY